MENENKVTSTAAKFAFPFEQHAKRQMDIPDGLDLADQMAYVTLRCIYKAYSDGSLSADRAKEEKKKLRTEWEKMRDKLEMQGKLAKRHIEVIKQTEAAKAEVLKNPTPENAIHLVEVLDGRFPTFDGGV